MTADEVRAMLANTVGAICVCLLVGGCGEPVGTYRIIDGDTFEIVATGERIRIANIDTPEMKGPCPVLAQKAKDHTAKLVALPGVTISRQGVDRYGRTLAMVDVQGQDLGEMLVSAGLARRWNSPRTECYR